MPNYENQPQPEVQSQPSSELLQQLGRVGLEGSTPSPAPSPETKKEFEYQLLQVARDQERSRQLRRSYILNTQRLVEKIENFQPDCIVFLDKSARPVSWLLKELWADLASEESPLPEFKFLNIDREQWRHKVGGSEIGSGQIKFDTVEREIKLLRELFTKPHTASQAEADNPTYLSGKRILVVDEVEVTGDTRRIAHGFLERAFPDAEAVADHTWMSAAAASSVGLPDVPTWYRQDTALGRGVGDRSESKSRSSASAAQRRGWLFLSTRPEGRDAEAERYRQEIKHLAQDWRQGRLEVT